MEQAALSPCRTPNAKKSAGKKENRGISYTLCNYSVAGQTAWLGIAWHTLRGSVLGTLEYCSLMHSSPRDEIGSFQHCWASMHWPRIEGGDGSLVKRMGGSSKKREEKTQKPHVDIEERCWHSSWQTSARCDVARIWGVLNKIFRDRLSFIL